ncbi:Nn.00g084280.m01.CDS01 [Neocucurbitaria sp. VM-36]
MARKRRGGAKGGHDSAQQGKACTSSTTICNVFVHLQSRLQSPGTADKSQKVGSPLTVSAISPDPTPAKKAKKPSVPGRVLSLHNLPSTIKVSDIAHILSPIEIVAYKRTAQSEGVELSDIAFVLFSTVEDAMRTFLLLDGSVINGATVSVNFVNGVKFEGDDTATKEAE